MQQLSNAFTKCWSSAFHRSCNYILRRPVATHAFEVLTQQRLAPPLQHRLSTYFGMPWAADTGWKAALRRQERLFCAWASARVHIAAAQPPHLDVFKVHVDAPRCQVVPQLRINGHHHIVLHARLRHRLRVRGASSTNPLHGRARQGNLLPYGNQQPPSRPGPALLTSTGLTYGFQCMASKHLVLLNSSGSRWLLSDIRFRV